MRLFNAVNGFSYMCVGETMMVLLAVRLGMPDSVVAIISGMLFFGYLILPLGKFATAKFGGAKTQAMFWAARNFAGLLVASATLWTHFGHRAAAAASMVAGAFLFYAFRAAGMVMAQPLIGDIAAEDERGKLISTNGGLFYAACFVALFLINRLMAFSPGAQMLSLVIAGGCVSGICSAWFVLQVDETRALRDSARQPILPDLRALAADSAFRRFLAASFFINLAIVMLIPAAILTLRKGLGVSEAGALAYSLGQFAASAAMSFTTHKIANKIGPRKTAIAAYALALAVAAGWALCPGAAAAAAMPVCAALFMAAGAFRTTAENSLTHYFLQTVPAPRRIAATMLMNTAAGVLSGIAGMALSGLLLHALESLPATHPGMTPLSAYRLYFGATFLVLLPGVIALLRITPLPLEKRWRRWVFGSHYR